MGHALGLPHTHGLTNMGTTDELADGSNCAVAGDRFCDTPADPNLLGKVDGACRYVGTARDARGMAYTPNTANIMSYSNTPCMTFFSPQQFAGGGAIGDGIPRACGGPRDGIRLVPPVGPHRFGYISLFYCPARHHGLDLASRRRLPNAAPGVTS